MNLVWDTLWSKLNADGDGFSFEVFDNNASWRSLPGTGRLLLPGGIVDNFSFSVSNYKTVIETNLNDLMGALDYQSSNAQK